MQIEERVEELLDRYEALRDSGQEPNIEEMCDDPQIRAEVLRRLAALRAFDTFLRSDEDHFTTPWDGPPSREGADGKPSVNFDAGRYLPLRFHAAGGLGQIFVARDTELKRDVALKRINARQARQQFDRQRFELEAEITGRLEHPGIVPVYGFGVDSAGQPYYAMRYIRGETLGDAIARRHSRRPADRGDARREHSAELHTLLRKFLAVCETVAYAHSRGVVHRDLKPANIMLGKYGETLVVDWGLAKPLSSQGGSSPVGESSEGGIELTDAGMQGTVIGSAKGSPIYMSPEQAAGMWKQVGPASDIYSLGATLYQLLTGQAPFSGATVIEILKKVKAGDFPAPRKVHPETPPPLEAICLKAMSHAPDQRYATALEMARDIENWLADEPVSAYREPLPLRAGRWMRRHRTAMSTAAAGATVALIALAVATLFLNEAWGKAEQRRKEAERQRTIAVGARNFADKQKTEAEKQAARARRLQKLAESQKVLATKAAELASKAKAEAERLAEFEKQQRQEIEQNLYRFLVLLADREIESNNVARALELLDQAPVAMRGWEWRHLRRRITGNVLTLAKAHTRESSDAVFSPDGRIVASAGGGEWEQPGEVKLWDAASGKLLATLSGHQQIAWRVAFHPEGKLLASTARDGTARLWSIPQGEPVHVFSPPSGGAFGIAFSADGKRLAVGGFNALAVYDVDSRQLVYEGVGHSGVVYDVAFSRQGDWLASCSSQWEGGPLATEDKPSQGEVKLWNAATGQLVRTIDGPAAQEVGSLAFSPDGALLAGSDRVSSFATLEPTGVKLWSTATGELVKTLAGHEDRIKAVAFHPGGRQLASGGDDQTIRIWDLETGRQLHVLRGHTGEVHRLAYSALGDRLVSAGDYDSSVRIWESDTAVAIRTLAYAKSSSSSVAFSSDSRRVATVDGDGQALVWDLETGRIERTFKAEKVFIARVVFSPTDPHLLVGSGAGEFLVFWNVQTGETIDVVKYHDRVQAMKFFPDGSRFAVGSWVEPTGFYETDTRRKIEIPLEGFERAAHDLSFSPRGNRLATCGENQVRVWDYTTGKLLYKHDKLNLDSVVQFSPDGQLLATSGYGDHVQLYEGDSGKPTGKLERHAEYWIDGIAFNNSGDRVATGGHDGNIKIWDVNSRREVLNLRQGRLTSVHCLAFSPDGRWLAAGIGGSVTIWDGKGE